MRTDWDRYNNALKDYRKECKTAHDRYLNEKIFSEDANNKSSSLMLREKDKIMFRFHRLKKMYTT